MEYNEIKKLVKLVESSQINELEIEEENVRVRILKQADPPKGVSRSDLVVQTSEPQIERQDTVTSAPRPAQPKPATVQAESKNIFEIKSPMVGTFYRAPSPEAPPYVQVGDRIKHGQELCIIEAMKLMNEIESETSGRIIEIAVENAQPVEFNQLLFKIEQD